MAFVAATTAKQNDGTGGNLTTNVPTHTDGDLLIMIWNDRNKNWTTPTGWTLMNQTSMPGVVCRWQMYYRYASSEPANYTTTSSAGTQGQQVIILCYSETTINDPTSPSPRNDDQQAAAADKDGVGQSTKTAGSNDCTGLLALYVAIISGYSNLGGEPQADPVMTPAGAITARTETRIYDTTPQGPVEFLWVGDAQVASGNEPSYQLDWTFQADPPNTIGTKYLVSQCFIGQVGAGGDVWGWGENDAWHDVA